MKRAILAVSARPSEAGEDGAEIIAASPDSGSFGPIRRGPMLLTRISHLMSVAGQTQKSAVVIVTSGLPPKAASSRASLHVRKVQPTADLLHIGSWDKERHFFFIR